MGYLYLTNDSLKKSSQSLPLQNNIILDLDETGNPIGIEFLTLDLVDENLLDDDFEVEYL